MTEQLTKVKNIHNHLEQSLKALDAEAEAVVRELKLESRMLPRAAYAIGMYARAVYYVLHEDLSLPRQRTGGW